MKIEIMPIQDLLRIPFLRNNLGTAIVFVTENSDIFNDNEIEQFKDILEDIEVYETIYVCCDAGISRSPEDGTVGRSVLRRMGSSGEL